MPQALWCEHREFAYWLWKPDMPENGYPSSVGGSALERGQDEKRGGAESGGDKALRSSPPLP